MSIPRALTLVQLLNLVRSQRIKRETSLLILGYKVCQVDYRFELLKLDVWKLNSHHLRQLLAALLAKEAAKNLITQFMKVCNIADRDAHNQGHATLLVHVAVQGGNGTQAWQRVADRLPHRFKLAPEDIKKIARFKACNLCHASLSAAPTDPTNLHSKTSDFREELDLFVLCA